MKLLEKMNKRPGAFCVSVLVLCVVSGTTLDYDVTEDYESTLDYKDPHWCHPQHLTNGEVTCQAPRGSYRSSLGSRCEMSCDRGHRLIGRSSITCLANRRWSGTTYCRKVRCRVLPVLAHGRFSCSQGLMMDSRCDFSCSPGFLLQGPPSRICQHGASWSGDQPVCVDSEPPRIKCPRSRIKFAEPGKLSAVVTWEQPTASDTADKTLEVILVGPESGTEFLEGANLIRYKVYDQAGNRAACKFMVRVEVRRCADLAPPLHGSLTCSSDTNNYGASCEYQCVGGHELRGVSSRVCQFNRSWSEDAPECVAMQIRSDVRSSQALLDQFYAKRRLLVLSAQNVSDNDYHMQNLMIQKADCGLDLRHVTVVELLGESGRIKESLLTPEVVEGLRQTFRISRTSFSLLLLDHLGRDRERFIAPASSHEIFSYVDNFLLDEEERERLELQRHLCEEASEPEEEL